MLGEIKVPQIRRTSTTQESEREIKSGIDNFYGPDKKGPVKAIDKSHNRNDRRIYLYNNRNYNCYYSSTQKRAKWDLKYPEAKEEGVKLQIEESMIRLSPILKYDVE